jgi:YgiT-type zinc finger domain-containing protein
MDNASAACTNCGGFDVRRADVRSAFWHDDRLVVVEDIPALLCGTCGEQFYEDRTVVMLDLLRGRGFLADTARTELRVPVFSFRDGAQATGEP